MNSFRDSKNRKWSAEVPKTNNLVEGRNNKKIFYISGFKY